MKKLLKKYWDGETTAEEENWLKQNAPELEADHSEESAYFKQLGQFSDLSLEESFDLDFLEKQSAQQPKAKRVSFFRNYQKIAAAVLVLVALSVATFSLMNKTPNTLTAEEDPEKAYQMAKQSLMLISAKLNKGVAYTYELEKFNEVQEKITIQNSKSK